MNRLELECTCMHPGCVRRTYTAIEVSAEHIQVSPGVWKAVLVIESGIPPALCRIHAKETP